MLATDTAGWIEAIGAAAAALGTVIAVAVALWQSRQQDRQINKRERRNDVRAAVDHAIASLVAGDHAVQQFVARVGTGQPQQIVQAAADKVSACEVDMRAAMASLSFRLGPDDDMIVALGEARDAFVAIYLAVGPVIINHEEGPEAVAPAQRNLDAFHALYERIIVIAERRFGTEQGSS